MCGRGSLIRHSGRGGNPDRGFVKCKLSPAQPLHRPIRAESLYSSGQINSYDEWGSHVKVFISWSGPTSHKVATILRDWLPSVIQSVEPYVSSEDIDKGARWSTDIAGELNQATFGLLCVTKDNVRAPWLNFEAGALGKSVDKSRVCPVLFRIKRSEVDGPILQFQSTICEKDDVLKLLKAVNTGCAEHGIDDFRLEKTFDVWWPSLLTELDAIVDEILPAAPPDKKQVSPNEQMEKVLEEVLELSRLNHQLLRNPEELLPAPYVRQLLAKSSERDMERSFDHPVFDELLSGFGRLTRRFRMFAETNKNVVDVLDLEEALGELRRPIEYILRGGPSSRGRRLPPGMIEELLGPEYRPIVKIK